MQYRLHIWDWPVRVFHWSLVLVVAGSIATGVLGGNAMDIHGRLGVALSGLLGFRLVWGVIGTRTARFSHFVRGPGSIRAYMQGRWRGIGHSPLGAVGVLALLALFSFQAVSGLFTNDDIAFSGPLRSLVDKATSDRISGIHRDMLWWLVGLVVVHVGAVLFYRQVKRKDLLGPMLRGWTIAQEPQTENTQVNVLALLVAIAAGVGCAVLASGLWIPEPPPVPVPATPDW